MIIETLPIAILCDTAILNLVFKLEGTKGLKDSYVNIFKLNYPYMYLKSIVPESYICHWNSVHKQHMNIYEIYCLPNEILEIPCKHNIDNPCNRLNMVFYIQYYGLMVIVNTSSDDNFISFEGNIIFKN